MPDVVSLRYEDACQKHQRLQRVEAENAALRAEKRVLEQRLLGVKHVLQPCDVLSFPKMFAATAHDSMTADCRNLQSETS